MFYYICFDIMHVRVWLDFILPEHTAGKLYFLDSTGHILFFLICHLFFLHRWAVGIDMDSVSSGSSLQLLAKLLLDAQEDDDDEHVVSVS